MPLCLLQAVDSEALKIVNSCYERALEVSHSWEKKTKKNCFQLCCLLTICTVNTKQNKEVHMLWIMLPAFEFPLSKSILCVSLLTKQWRVTYLAFAVTVLTNPLHHDQWLFAPAFLVIGFFSCSWVEVAILSFGCILTVLGAKSDSCWQDGWATSERSFHSPSRVWGTGFHVWAARQATSISHWSPGAWACYFSGDNDCAKAQCPWLEEEHHGIQHPVGNFVWYTVGGKNAH